MTFSALAAAAVVLVAAMSFAWAVRMATGKSGWIDAIWSAAVGVAGLIVALGAGPGATGRHWLVAALVGLWSVRLAAHIAARSRGAPDDPRYADLARQWGAAFPIRLFLFLQIQAAAGFVLVGAIALAAANPAPFVGGLDLVACAVALVAIAGEGLADAQLARFRRSAPPGGAICEVGLWRWSRHPNYFFEWLGWCAFALLAIDPSGAWPVGLLAVAAPLLMYALLVHVSGIPPLEAHMAATRGDAFRAYRARVSAFFPLPRRRVWDATTDEGAVAAAPDERTTACTTVAWLIAANKPIYPLYVWWFVGSGVAASCLTMVSLPLFAALAWAGRRRSLLLRVGLPVVGFVDTLFATKLFGPAGGTELFAVPCLLLACLSFRADEVRWARGLVVGLFLGFVVAHGRLGAPLGTWTAEELGRLLEINILAVASLSAFIGLRFSGFRQG